MAVYCFRVTYEDHEDIYRDIEIKSLQNFEDFHRAIQEAIGFDNSKPASFYMSDDYWRKGFEITLFEDKNDDDDDRNRKKPKKLMHKSKIADFIEDPHQKMLYVFDFEAQWTFWIELKKISLEQPKGTYPKCVKTAGKAPKQYKVTNIPPPIDEEDEINVGKEKEKIFHHEEGYDEHLNEDDDMITEGEDDEINLGENSSENEIPDNPEIDPDNEIE